ncbi:acetate--CoA ligase family protein [Desulfobacter curvatus]|uniref:acetate--CoA ligase family protein n=1 Tax=Desulfobacter curvatus TaxID=2290 RepID=UPI0003734F0C|nr:acetate--CoA ligase family protein [Desulfobacter curvatus]
MQLDIDFDAIERIFSNAWGQGRDFLFESEVYELLAKSGAETFPQVRLIERGTRIADDELVDMPGEKSVLKIVSPYIIHKTEVGGVRVVDKAPNKIRSAVRRMFYEVPENYAAGLALDQDGLPAHYRGLTGDDLASAVSRDIKGVLQVQYMPPDSAAFGNELIVGLRRTREFGTIFSAGLGGTDTELYARRFRKGQAIVAASPAMCTGEQFFQLYRETISYRKLAGLTRGQRRIVTDEQLVECFESFIQMGNTYCLENPQSVFVIDELEINPFAFTDFLMVPLDGMCRFSKQKRILPKRPVGKIDNLLHPVRMGIIGVSSTRKNFGRIILDNVLAQGFGPENMVIFKKGMDQFLGIDCLPDLAALAGGKGKLDLFIVAVGADQVPGLVEDIIEKDVAHAVMLIPGGLGETHDSQDKARQVVDAIHAARTRPDTDGGPVFLGANCMGVISLPGSFDTWFIPEEKLPKDRSCPRKFCRAALISQSGAFMLHRSHQCPQLAPAYMISMGNQTDLTLGDMMTYFKDSDQVDVIAVYAEGFNDLDGLAFCRAIRDAVLAGKEVVFYKAGRTPEGKAATSSHTASLAGDYMVCESCVSQTGAIVARTFSEFQELMLLSETLNAKTIHGDRLAAVSGAGFEAVGMADSIQSDDFTMELARFDNKAVADVRSVLAAKGLDRLVTISNPMDINPAADDQVHGDIAAILCRDPGVDAVIISVDPMSPAMQTLDTAPEDRFSMNQKGAVLQRLIHLNNTSATPIVAVVDGGRLYDPLRDALIAGGIPVFNVCDGAVAALSLYIQGRLQANAIRGSQKKGVNYD